MSRILVIEDNDDLAFGLRNNLEIEGHEVEVAADGTDGLVRARRATADLVILDLMLPGTDGFRILRALRQDKLTSERSWLFAVATNLVRDEGRKQERRRRILRQRPRRAGRRGQRSGWWPEAARAHAC